MMVVSGRPQLETQVIDVCGRELNVRGVEVVGNWLQQLLARRMDPLQVWHQFRPLQVRGLLQQ